MSDHRARVALAVVLAVWGAGPSAGAPPAHAAATHHGVVAVGGLQRTYRVRIPPPAARAGPMPVVLALHGGGGTGEAMERLSLGGLTRLADREGVIVVYPDGVERHWNDGRTLAQYRAHRENIDDVGFIAALIDHLAQALPIDPRRVYATGISNGGQMAFRLARELADRIAAIAPVATSMSEQVMQMRVPARPVPVLLMPGTHDPLVPWGGGEVGFPGGRSAGRVIAVTEAVRYWVAHNGCPPAASVTWEPDRDPRDGTRVRRDAYGPCRDGVEVVLYAVLGGGHTWPGGLQYLPEAVIGRTSRDIDANEVIWAFVRRHAVGP